MRMFRAACRLHSGAMVVMSLMTGLALAVPGAASAKESEWAVFDSQRAMEATTHFKEAKAALEKELKERETELEAKKKELKERRDAIEAKKAVASSDSLLEQEGALVQEEQQLAQMFFQAQRELSLFEQKLKEQLFLRLEVAIKEVAERGDNTFVVDKSKVLYHRPKLEITDEVIKAYVRRFGDKPLDLTAVKLSRREQK